MGKVARAVLQVLDERPQGVTVQELHQLVFDKDRHAIEAEYVRPLLSNTPSNILVYSHGVASTVAALLRDKLVEPAEGGKIRLTLSGKSSVEKVKSEPARKPQKVKISSGSKQLSSKSGGRAGHVVLSRG